MLLPFFQKTVTNICYCFLHKSTKNRSFNLFGDMGKQITCWWKI